MSDVARLIAAFDAGTLVRPSSDVPNTVDLARAVASLCGIADLELTATARKIARAIGRHQHYVFVLVDGLGMNLVEQEGPDGFFRAHTVMELQSVFPSSTAPALTSLATGCWPAEHAVPGWFTYLPDDGITATILPFVERYTKEDARKLGVTPASAFPLGPLATAMTHTPFRVMPKYIDGSVYSLYSSGDAPSYGYRSLRGGIDAACEFIAGATGPTHTYFYIPFVDTAEHKRGVESKAVRRALKLVRSRVETLAHRLEGQARIIVTADHGQIDVPPEHQTVLPDDDLLLTMLQMPPSCEYRVLAFHVIEGREAEFELEFLRRLGDQFALLTIDEVDEARLFGPMALSTETRRRLGDYVAVALGPYAIRYKPEHQMMGFHGGLQRDEMRVPLILV